MELILFYGLDNWHPMVAYFLGISFPMVWADLGLQMNQVAWYSAWLGSVRDVNERGRAQTFALFYNRAELELEKAWFERAHKPNIYNFKYYGK